MIEKRVESLGQDGGSDTVSNRLPGHRGSGIEWDPVLAMSYLVFYIVMSCIAYDKLGHFF